VAENFKSRNIVNGAFGRLYMDGTEMAEIKDAEANLENEYEDVNLHGGKKGQKLKSTNGKGKFTFHKVDSWELKKFFNKNKNMMAVDFMLELEVDDPDALGAERITISECELSGNLNLFKMSRDSLIEKEIEFWFDKDSVEIPELI
jgi:hypothetical protein